MTIGREQMDKITEKYGEHMGKYGKIWEPMI
jgi:hypothetical protein